VIDAAKTKPFDFMPFYPGPGLGGHCVPIEPFYLTWKAREFDVATRVIELAGEIMPGARPTSWEKSNEVRDPACRPGLQKERRRHAREPFAEVDRGGSVDYHDPFIPVISKTGEHSALAGRSRSNRPSSADTTPCSSQPITTSRLFRAGRACETGDQYAQHLRAT
jgi:UDP-N-acetyl-D-glucosamine dehydrogenase